MSDCAELLAELIGFPTQNPGGDEVALCHHLAAALRARGAGEVSVTEVPRERDGVSAVGGYVLAAFGTPRTLVNVHLDTVPPNTGWTVDPWRAQITEDRVVGLGAADTKGAIAAVLVALEQVTPRNLGILFSGDEERGSTCMRHFLGSEAAAAVERAVVCEPTARAAGIRHRGVLCYRAEIKGRGGHSSAADRMPKPVVAMARLAIELDALGKTYLDRGPEQMTGLCLNIAKLEGGVAFNVVPDSASLTWSLRPPPGFDRARWDTALDDCIARAGAGIRTALLVSHAPFQNRDATWVRDLVGAHATDLVSLQYWTEAAALSTAGIDAVVIGPGDIAQAHAADEFVTRADLQWAVDLFTAIFARSVDESK
jgi:acetylornithine deacetylase